MRARREAFDSCLPRLKRPNLALDIMTTTTHTWVENVGQRALRSPAGLRARLRFANTALTAAVSVPRSLRAEVRARTAEQLWRCGLRQLPIVALLGLALGLLIVGQAVALLRQV